MLESTLGPDKFRDGIRRYMAKYKFGNTVTEQLWAELSAAAGQPVAEIAHGYTLQGGVPLVTLTGSRCTGGMTTATLAQGRFGLDEASKTPQTWQVPLVVATIGGGETRTIVTGPSTAVSVKGCGTLLLNKGKGSYTRVLYDQPGHDALVRDYMRLPLEDRLGTLADDYALAAGGYQDLSRYFAVMGQVGATADPLEWSLVSGRLGSLNGLFDRTPLSAPLRARTVAILGPVLQRIGYTARPDESPLVGNLRENLVGQLGDNGDPEVLRQARSYVARLPTDPTAIPPSIRQPILATFAANATAADWDLLLRLAKAETNPVAKNRFVSLLGYAKDDALAARALALLKTDTFTAPQRAALLRAVSGEHPDMTFDWAVANRALVEGFIEESSKASFIVGLGGGSVDPKMPEKIAAFAATMPETSRGPARRVVSGIAVRKAAAERLRPAVQTWLGKGA